MQRSSGELGGLTQLDFIELIVGPDSSPLRTNLVGCLKFKIYIVYHGFFTYQFFVVEITMTLKFLSVKVLFMLIFLQGNDDVYYTSVEPKRNLHAFFSVSVIDDHISHFISDFASKWVAKTITIW